MNNADDCGVITLMHFPDSHNKQCRAHLHFTLHDDDDGDDDYDDNADDSVGKMCPLSKTMQHNALYAKYMNTHTHTRHLLHNLKEASVAARSNAWVCDRSLAGIAD
jgi:hypothetical protein